jgi:hypothetical protein
MGSFLFKTIGHKAAHRAMKRHTENGGPLDIKYGFSLFKDRNVPATSKLLALTIGVSVTALLMALEAPLELILGLFIPFLGLTSDLFIDGIEVLVFPLLIACLVLPRLVTRKRAYVTQAVNRKS